MKYFWSLSIAFCFLLPTLSLAQDSLLVGKPYLEDQLFLGLAYNSLVNKQEIVNQNGLSLGLQTGYIRDIPLNKRRNFGLGIGLGYEYNKFQTNLQLADAISIVSYYTQNKFETHGISLPIEIRYRTSRDNVYKFWRVYAGVKVSYTFYSRTLFVDNDYKRNSTPNISLLNKWQIGPQIALGYNTFNFYAYWNATKLLNHTVPSINNFDPNKVSYIKFGLQFYIF